MSYKITQQGFTLVEMLLVTAIIGILVAIIIPQFNSYRYRAYNSAAMVDANHLKSGMEAYKTEHDQYPASLLFQ
ncbi:MAG TPA: prepilin-type N-terminal cleavage/methylation domain-containing protein [Geomonas sp.]|nr:prepilin-type N-terminal cleavage/methylation domain-containing protein [Geomonas sp.]